MAISVRRAEQIAAVVAIGLLAAACFAVLRPFVAAILWAFVIALATWPAYERVLNLAGGRRTSAATLMLLGLTLVLVLPLAFAGLGLTRNVPLVIDWGRALIANPPSPPGWLLTTPVLDDTIGLAWQELADKKLNLASAVEPYMGAISRFLLDLAAGIGSGLFQLSMSLLVVFFLYRDGEAIAAEVRHLVERVAGSWAERLVREAHGTMTGVLYGIIGTAIIQGALTGLGLWFAGVPAAFLLGIAAAVFSPIPFGVGLVIWPTALWLAANDSWGAAIFVAVWGIAPVGLVDNFVRPFFVRRSSKLPFVLILMGLIGGALFAGVVGLFLGPVILAVAYTLIRGWAAEQRDRQAAGAAHSGPD